MKSIKKVLLLVLTLAIVQGQEQFGAGQTLHFNCTSQQKTFFFKTMREFSILSQAKDDRIYLSAENTTCTLSNLHSQICTFENMTKEINISCPGVSLEQPRQIKLKVDNADILADQEQIDSDLVQIPLENEEQGVISLRLTDYFAAEVVRINSSTKHKTFPFFLHSDCVDSISLFEDNFKISVRRKPNPCTVGLINHTSSWKFFKTITNFSDSQKIYTGYLRKNAPKTYQLLDSHNVSLYFVFESQELTHLTNLSIKAEFVSQNGNQTFTMNNFQAGLPMFDTFIYLNRSFSVMILTANRGIFYAVSTQSPHQSNPVVTQDSYLYTEVRKNGANDFIIELAGFEEQGKVGRIVMLTNSNNKTIHFTYQQCVNQACHNTSASSEMIAKGQFVPKCKHLTNDMCYVKVELFPDFDGPIGILPLAYNSHVELELNKVHHGRLQRWNLLHFMVSKQNLSKSRSEVLIVSSTGAKVYLTYNPDCKRIFCTQYWAVSNTIEVPNERKDLFIFIQGTINSHYTLLVDTLNQGGVSLPEGLGISGQLTSNQKSRYYLYTPSNSTKAFQINCNALPNSLLLMINIRKSSFPQKGSAAFSSKDCYIHISANEYDAGDVAHITIERIQDTKTTINYNLVGVTEGNAIIGHWRQPFYDFFQPNSTKVFKYLISIPTDQISFKMDVYQQARMAPLIVVFGDSQTVNYKVQIADVSTFTIETQKQQRICASQTVNQCYLYVSVFNPGTVGLQVSLTAWQRQQAIKLMMGEYSNFQTGALGQQTHFYIPVEDLTKPINVYIFSNHVEIEAIGQLWNANTHLPILAWPFPSFMFLPNQTLEHLVYSFSASLYFGKQALKTVNKSAVILVTVRDKSILSNRTLETLTNPGNIQLAVSNGFLKLREDDKFQYNINNDETYHFQFPIGSLLEMEKQEVYFNNVALSGIGQITYYYSNEHYNETTAAWTSQEMVTVRLDDYKQRAINRMAKDYHSITFAVKCIGGSSCKFLASIVSSSSDYRQLTLGVPQQFYIPPHSSAIFEFNDFYNEDFKIKVQREEGFPEYKIKSCNTLRKIDCVAPLLKKQNVSDESTLILTGRSHELKIDTKSPYYCKGCTYYIVFYSHNQSIYGSLTITRPGQAIILRESVPLTTELYSDDEDSYIISSIPDSERYVSIVPHMGQVSIELIQMLPNNGKKPKIHNQNTSSKASIHLQIERTQVSVPYNLKIKSFDRENVMYTIVLSSKKNLVSLEDGVPYKATYQPNSNTKLNFEPSGKSTILITSTTPLSLQLICEDTNSTLTHQHNIKHSKVLNTSLIHLNKAECEKYVIEINNKKLANVTILPNDEQIMLLPFQMAVPSLSKKDFCQMYQVPIQQKTHLKIVLLICQPGSAVLGISHDKHHMFNKKYDKKFTISGDRYMEVFEYTANPGILYFQVHAQSDLIEYTIQIFPFYKQSQESETKVHISDGYIQTQFVSSNKFKLQFQPFQILNSDINYTISYVVIETPQRSYLRKALRCSSTFFDISNPNTTYKETNLNVLREADGSLSAIYEPSFPHSYITIIALSTPGLPSYIARPSYEIAQLSAGKGPRFFEHMVFKLIGVLESITGVDDQNMLNLMLVFVIVVGNILLITLCCWIGARHCRKTIVIERKRLATNQKQGRLMRVQNSLDMLESREQTEVEVQKQEQDLPQVP